VRRLCAAACERNEATGRNFGPCRCRALAFFLGADLDGAGGVVRLVKYDVGEFSALTRLVSILAIWLQKTPPGSRRAGL
jgi:hypothetical protein